MKNSAFDTVMAKASELAGEMSKNTVKAYKRHWDDFAVMLEDDFVESVADISRSHVLKYLADFKRSPSAYNQARSALFKLLKEVSVDEDIPKLQSILYGVKAAKIPRDAPRLFMTAKELAEVRHALVNDIYYEDVNERMRNILMYDMLRKTLMRIDELMQLQLKDIDVVNGMLDVRGKGGLEGQDGVRAVTRHIKIRKDLAEQIIDYIDNHRYKCIDEPCRPNLNNPDSIQEGALLFTTRNNESLKVSTAKKVITHAIKYALGDKKNLRDAGPHAIRRSSASLVYKRTKDIVLVQQMLGHANVETTLRYLGVDRKDLAEAFESID